MIRGVVNVDREAIIRLLVKGTGGQQQRIEAVIDTGYDGWLCLPPSLIVLLGLPWQRRSRAVLADGSQIGFDIYRGRVVWDRRQRQIPVDEADTEPLVGMALLAGYELNVQIRHRGSVTIQALPERESSKDAQGL
jgi:clan AA aspartic protease